MAGDGIACGFLVLGPDLVRLSASLGDRARAEATTRAVKELAAGAPTPSTQAVALWCRGLLAVDAGSLLESAEAFRSLGRPLEEALTREEAAVALAAAGRSDIARDSFIRAVSLYERLEATWDKRRAEARLRAAGFRLGRRGSRKRPASGWDSLTETELVVAELVAQRLSNLEIAQRLFLSRHTVHTHVSHVLAKLGLTSRLELVELQSARKATAPS
jgi:DNA-binding CsgD family transcriptional regulator